MEPLEFCLEVKGEKAGFCWRWVERFEIAQLLGQWSFGMTLSVGNPVERLEFLSRHFWSPIGFNKTVFGTGTFGGGPQSRRNYINVLFRDCYWNACRSASVIGGCSPTWRNPKKNFWQNLCSQATTDATLFVFVPSLAAWRLWGTASIFATQNCCWCT